MFRGNRGHLPSEFADTAIEDFRALVEDGTLLPVCEGSTTQKSLTPKLG